MFLPTTIRSNPRRALLSRFGLCVLSCFLAVPSFAGFDSNVGGPKPGEPPMLPPGVVPRELEGVGIDEHLGRTIDLDLEFVAENGYPVKLKEFFYQGRPVILDLVYYNCPMLCTLILNGQTQAMKDISWTPGKDYEVVTISIDPREAFNVAREKKDTYVSILDKPGLTAKNIGWHFLTDKDNNAKKLAELVGYHYRYDKRQEQYAHASAIMILTPEGKLARYLYGIRYPSRDMRFALAEASEGRFTMAVEKLLLFCYHYDPQANRYVLFAMNVMRGGGILTVLIISLFLWRLFRADKIRTAELARGLRRLPNSREGIA
jgi:protein SCO1